MHRRRWILTVLLLVVTSGYQALGQSLPPGKCEPPDAEGLDFYITFPYKPATRPPGCTLPLQVTVLGVEFPYGSPGITIIVNDPCAKPPNDQTRYRLKLAMPEDGPQEYKNFLIAVCGEAWWYKYEQQSATGMSALASPVPLMTRRDTTTAARPAGQASQGLLSADVNGDGIPDTVTLGTNGVTVEVLDGNAATVTTNQYSLTFPTTSDNSNLVAADFNGDGKVDLAVSNLGTVGSDPGSIAILLGNGDGTFQAPRYMPGGVNPLALAAADFNGDGKIDLVAGSQSSANVSLLTGNGDGTFGSPVSYPTGGDSHSVPVSLLAVDLNGDGRADLAVANQGFVTANNSGYSVLLNSGTGFRTPSATPLAMRPSFLAYSDLNNDGKPDLVATSTENNALLVLMGNGDGTFQAPGAYATGNAPASVAIAPLPSGISVMTVADAETGVTWFTTVSPQGAIGAPQLNIVGGAPTGIALADLNGDGQPDAVVVGGSKDVSVLLGKNGVLQPPVGYSLAQASPMPLAVAAADFNGDGKPDIVTASTTGAVSVLLGNGDGTLKSPAGTQVTVSAQSLAAADFNRDSKMDLAVASYGSFNGSGAVTVLPGNGNGTFGAALTLSGPAPHAEAVAAGDLNGDGIPDLAALWMTGVGSTATLAVYLGKGDGTFQAARTFPLQIGGGTQGGIAIGDWNGDGKPDLAAVSNSTPPKIDVLIGDGAGGFREASTLPATDDLPVNITTADLDGDGRPDLIVAHCCGQLDATYLLSNGDGTFQAEQQFLSGSSPMAVAAAPIKGGTLLVTADNVGTVTANELPQGAAVPTLTITANGSAASSTITSLAPASIATLYGTNLAIDTQPGDGTATSLLGTSVTITDSKGAQQTAPLFYVSPAQVNYLVPAATALGTAHVTVTSGAGAQGSAAAQVGSIAPGIFALNAGGLAAAVVLVVAPGGAQSFANIYQVDASGNIVAQPIDLSAGQIYLELYGTGIRAAKSVTATVGGVSVPVLGWAVQSQYAGLDQVNIGPLPASLKDQVTVAVTADGMAANPVNVTIK